MQQAAEDGVTALRAGASPARLQDTAFEVFVKRAMRNIMENSTGRSQEAKKIREACQKFMGAGFGWSLRPHPFPLSRKSSIASSSSAVSSPLLHALRRPNRRPPPRSDNPLQPPITLATCRLGEQRRCRRAKVRPAALGSCPRPGASQPFPSSPSHIKQQPLITPPCTEALSIPGAPLSIRCPSAASSEPQCPCASQGHGAPEARVHQREPQGRGARAGMPPQTGTVTRPSLPGPALLPRRAPQAPASRPEGGPF